MSTTRAVRRALLAGHVVLATAGIGLEVAVLVGVTSHPLTATVAADPEVTRLFTVLAVTVTLALVSGIVGAGASPWSLLRTGWVVKKLGLNLLTVASVTALSVVAAHHAGLELWVLGLVTVTALVKSLLSVVLSVYKPGRRAGAQAASSGAVRRGMSSTPTTISTATPRIAQNTSWVAR